MRRGKFTRLTGRLGAVLVFAALGACQSMDSLESLLDRDTRNAPPPKVANSAAAAPQVREQRPEGSPPPAPATQQAAQAQASSQGPVRLQRPASDTTQNPAPAQQAPRATAGATTPTETQQQETPAQQQAAGEETSPAQADSLAEGGEETGKRIAVVPKGEGFGGDLTRRFDKLFNSTTAVRQPDELVKASDVTGAWLLDEEDGLRTCTVTLAAPESDHVVQPATGCSGLATRAARWSIFGSDLLLSTADNTVVARLRRSGDSWIGFTLETGIPLVLSRQATGQG